MDCERVREHLIDYLYGELPPELQATVEDALGGCAECQAELAELRRIHQLAASLPSLEVPAPVHANIMREARLHADALRAGRGSVFASLKALFASPAFASALVVCLALAVGLTLARQGSGPEGSAPTADAPRPQAAPSVVASNTEEVRAPEVAETAQAPVPAVPVEAVPEDDPAAGPVARLETFAAERARAAESEARASQEREWFQDEGALGTNAARGLAADELLSDLEVRMAQVAESAGEGEGEATALPETLELMVVEPVGEAQAALRAEANSWEPEVGGVGTGALAQSEASRVAEETPSGREQAGSRSRAANEGGDGRNASPRTAAPPRAEPTVATADPTPSVSARPAAERADERPAGGEPEAVAAAEPEEGVEHLEQWNYGQGFEAVPRAAGGDSDWEYGRSGVATGSAAADRERAPGFAGAEEPEEPEAFEEAETGGAIDDTVALLASEETEPPARDNDDSDYLARAEVTYDVAAERQVAEAEDAVAGRERDELAAERQRQAAATLDALGGVGAGGGSDSGASSGERRERERGAGAAPPTQASAAPPLADPSADGATGASEGTYERAFSRYNDGSYREAVALFDDFIQEAPRSSSLYALAAHYRGIAAFRIGDYSVAVSSLRSALADADFERVDESRYYLARAYEALGRFDEAEAEYRALADSDDYSERSDEGVERLRASRRARSSSDQAAPAGAAEPATTIEVE
jgi:anti-sigma factor RsiW/TolA-binding protein